jgi:hypothetical protein
MESTCTNAYGKPCFGLFGLDENLLHPSPSLRCCLCMQLERWGVLRVRLTERRAVHAAIFLTEQCSAACRARWSAPVLCRGDAWVHTSISSGATGASCKPSLTERERESMRPALNERIDHVRLSYNPYFSVCFLARTIFFSHNK